ncbi:MAG TPA: alpha/beta fold hydrolase [Deferrimonas sp.]
MTATVTPAYWDMGSGVPVVLLHCSMSSKDQWRSLARLLKGEYRVIAFDLYGYGETPLPAGIDTFSLGDEIALVERGLAGLLEEGEPFHLVGHSYGGAVALRLAHDRPERLRSLTLFEPVAFHLLRRDDPALQPVLQMARDLAAALGAGDPLAAAARFIDYWGGEGSFAATSLRTRELLAASIVKAPADFRALLDDPLSLDDCRTLDLPICLMAGRQSRLPALRVADLLGDVLPRCTRVWVPGGHMAPVTEAAQVNLLIREHLQRIA